VSDNLFEQLFELLQSPGPVNWRLAREVTKSIAGEPEPLEPLLAEEYLELGLAADLRLANGPTPGVASLDGPEPHDRTAWVDANQQAFSYLMEPMAEKLGGSQLESAGPMAAMLQPLAPAILGMQAGTMIGFMSHRVMGQFDAGLPPLGVDRSILVVPNVEAFAADHGVDRRQVRLWATLHEMVHQAVLSLDSVRDHVADTIDSFFAGVEIDQSGLMDTLNALQNPEQLESSLATPGAMASMLGATSRPDDVANIQALVAFLEGYGDYTIRLAGADVLPDLDRMEEANGRRRTEPTQAEQFLQQILGLDLDRHRAREGAEFCAAVVQRWGDEALQRIWQEPRNMPRLDELTDPVGWAARVLLDDFPEAPTEAAED
jgi:putative hydrolase